MRITQISLQNFRAYEEPFEIDLEGGKNLLLHGENGAGKSSLYFALRRFFEERGGLIAEHRNHFADSARASFVRLHIKGPDSTGVEYDNDVWWDDPDGHPLTVPKDPKTTPIPKELRSLLVDAARRSGFLDYRAMLKTSLLAKPIARKSHDFDLHSFIYGADREGLEAQLFDVVTWVILDGVRVTAAGGGESTIGNLIREVWRTRPSNRYKKTLRRAERATSAFNQAFATVLPTLESKIPDFLTYFENCELEVEFAPVSINWNPTTLALDGAVLVPDISFRKKPFADHSLDLNEARLSALAICFFLGGVLLSDNDYQNPAHPRFLFLDDALIGLDLKNRLPTLRILSRDEFKYYQIFLLTHDRVWFDLARGHLPEKSGWLHKQLIADEDAGRLVPRLQPSDHDLARAKMHLGAGDRMAAAVYTRAAFEARLRNVCEKNGIKIPYKPDSERVSAGVLWDGIIQRQREREEQRSKGSKVPDFVPAALEADVETMRSTVLNKLSHTGASSLVTSEVAAAIATVEHVVSHKFPKP